MQEDYLERIERSEMTYYRETYKNSKRWTGEPLQGKTILIYCEQGLGDTIQFARYFNLGCQSKVILHCPKALHRLLGGLNGIAGVFDKDDPNLPPHDYHVLSMSLPFNDVVGSKPPYIKADPTPLEGFELVKKIGICWEGNPDHPNNLDRSCPLRYFKALVKPDRKLFMLQKEVQNKDFANGCADLDLNGVPINDMHDLAGLISAMDIVISVDTAVLHLAGAMGKRVFGLLSKSFDHRWRVRNWYPSTALLFQGKKGDWIPVFAGLMMLLDTILESKKPSAEIDKLMVESFTPQS